MGLGGLKLLNLGFFGKIYSTRSRFREFFVCFYDFVAVNKSDNNKYILTIKNKEKKSFLVRYRNFYIKKIFQRIIFWHIDCLDKVNAIFEVCDEAIHNINFFNTDVAIVQQASWYGKWKSRCRRC